MSSIYRISGERAILVLSLAAVVLLVVFPVQNFDIFWHLANGRAMLQEGRIAEEEIFSYTVAGERFHNHEWLSQLALYVTYLVGGASGLLAFKVGAVLLIFVLIYRTSLILGAPRSIASVLPLVTILVAAERYSVRPQLFSFLFLALFGFLFYGVRAGRLHWRWLLAVPLVTALWDVTHGSVYGVMFGTACVAAESLKRVLPTSSFDARPDAAFLKRLWIVFVLTLVTAALNPWGIRTFGSYFAFVGNKSLIVTSVAEFEPARFGEAPLFWFLLGLAVLLGIAFFRRRDLTHVFTTVPFAILALKHNRMIAPFAVVLAPVLGYYSGLLASRAEKLRVRGVAPVIGAIILAVCLTDVMHVKFLSPGHVLEFGLGVDERRMPAGAVRFVEHADPPGNMYNRGDLGGYLAYHLYPGRRIFQYNLPAVFGDLMQETQSQAFIDKYAITYAITRHDAWSELLFPREQWVPVYWDTAAVVLLRNVPANRHLLERYALRYYTPGIGSNWLAFLESSPDVLPTLTREVAQVLRFGTNPPLAAYLGRVSVRPESRLTPEDGIRIIEASLEYNAGSAPLWLALSEFYRRAGRPQDAHVAASRADGLTMGWTWPWED